MIKNSTLKLALAAATLGTIGLIAAPNAQAERKKDSSVHSYNMVMQSRGRLGAQVISMSSDLRGFFGAPADAGLLVDSVLADSPAAKAGLKTGDVIVGVEGQDIREAWDIFGALSPFKKGDTVKLEIVRNKKKRTLSATLDGEGMDMRWRGNLGARGGFPGGFDFDFKPSDIFNHDWSKNFGKSFGERFPMAPQSTERLQEKMRRLEERLNRLEGKPSAPAKKPKPNKGNTPNKGGKQFKTAPSGLSTSS